MEEEVDIKCNSFDNTCDLEMQCVTVLYVFIGKNWEYHNSNIAHSNSMKSINSLI